MGDYNRDGAPEREHITERTTIVTDTGERRGGGGWAIGLLVLIVLLVVLFLVFGNVFNRAADQVGVNVAIDAPKVEMPDSVKIEVPDEVKVEVPDEIKVETNSAQ
jgi:hypothetical protein